MANASVEVVLCSSVSSNTKLVTLYITDVVFWYMVAPGGNVTVPSGDMTNSDAPDERRSVCTGLPSTVSCPPATLTGIPPK